MMLVRVIDNSVFGLILDDFAARCEISVAGGYINVHGC